MNIEVRDRLYDVKSLLQERSTDFDIMRERPLIFSAKGRHLVCAPVKWRDHPAFVQDLARLLTRYYEIFQKVEFLSSDEYRESARLQQAIGQVALFDGTRAYRLFVTRGLPRFFRKWAFTLDRKEKRIIRIRRRHLTRILDCFSVDELLEVFFCLFVFNYDIVKKKTFNFLTHLQIAPQAPTTSLDSFTDTSRESVMPPYSPKRFSRSDLALLAQQSRPNSTTGTWNQ